MKVERKAKKKKVKERKEKKKEIYLKVIKGRCRNEI